MAFRRGMSVIRRVIAEDKGAFTIEVMTQNATGPPPPTNRDTATRGRALRRAVQHARYSSLGLIRTVVHLNFLRPYNPQ